MDMDVSWFDARPLPVPRMHSSAGFGDVYNTNSLSASDATYRSFDDSPHELPSVFRPVPLKPTSSYSALADPELCLTPERRIPTLVRLRQSSGDECTDGYNPLRESRVKFDHNVAVHHLSPEYSTYGTSPDSSSLDAMNSSLQSVSVDDNDLARYTNFNYNIIIITHGVLRDLLKRKRP